MQRLTFDNIPNILVASTTTVTLAATADKRQTRITVGGQQYGLTALLTLNAATVGANGLDVGALGVGVGVGVAVGVIGGDYPGVIRLHRGRTVVGAPVGDIVAIEVEKELSWRAWPARKLRQRAQGLICPE